MKNVLRTVISLLLTAVLVAPALADIGTAQNLARNLSGQGELPVNVRLRLQILADQLPKFNEADRASSILSFFSNTRVMVWNQPVSANTQNAMRELERNMVALARSKGRNLDLPPVGYGPAGGPANAGSLISGERITRAGLANVVLQTEQVATELVQRNALASDLLYLRDSLTHLRQDIADPAVAAASLRQVLDARARFLASQDAQLIRDPRLMSGLNQLGEVIRGTFPPQRLRTAGPAQIPFQ